MISQGEVLSVDEFGRLALHYAAEQGHDICLEVLCASFLKGSIEVEVQSALRPCFASLGISLINYFYSVGFSQLRSKCVFTNTSKQSLGSVVFMVSWGLVPHLTVYFYYAPAQLTTDQCRCCCFFFCGNYFAVASKKCKLKL